jgi:hypothetical protein
MTLRTNAPYRHVALIDASGVSAEFDALSRVIPTIDFAHHEIHEGDSFFVLDYIDLTNGQVYDIQIATPDSADLAHMTFTFQSEAEATIIFYEAITATGGTPITAYNHYRDSATVAGVVLAHTPSVSNTGTRLVGWIQGSGKTSGGGATSRNEFILKRNKKYLLRITNSTTSNNWFQYALDWYEHGPE